MTPTTLSILIGLLIAISALLIKKFFIFYDGAQEEILEDLNGK